MAFTCPDCRRASHNPHDEEHGYCGNCREFKRPTLRIEVHLMDGFPSMMGVVLTDEGPGLTPAQRVEALRRALRLAEAQMGQLDVNPPA
jgi:hypothetical protein